MQVYLIQTHEDGENDDFERFFTEARAQEEESKQEIASLSLEQREYVHVPKLNPLEEEALAREEQYIERARKFKGFVGHKKDDFRDPNAAYYGGFQLTDTELSGRLRSAGKEILKTVIWCGAIFRQDLGEG